MKHRLVIKDVINHCYQRSADGGLLFYSSSDYLVYFTLFCTCARKYNIKAISLCQMPDHIHAALTATSAKDLTSFFQELNSRFAKEYNSAFKLKGKVFEATFNSVPKKGPKAARNNIIYIGNNPVERQLVTRAEEYRWNYLAYSNSSHPFSEKYVTKLSSREMRRVMKLVESQHSAGRPLNYQMLRNISSKLSLVQKQQLIDRIITCYNVIDYDLAAKFFNSADEMIASMHYNTGNEYDLNEVFVGRDDKHYAQMTSVLMKQCGFNDIHEFLCMDTEGKMELFRILRRETYAMAAQICKYLHMNMSNV